MFIVKTAAYAFLAILIIRLLPLRAQVFTYFGLAVLALVAAALTASDGWPVQGLIVCAGSLVLTAYAFQLRAEYRRSEPEETLETPLF